MPVFPTQNLEFAIAISPFFSACKHRLFMALLVDVGSTASIHGFESSNCIITSV